MSDDRTPQEEEDASLEALRKAIEEEGGRGLVAGATTPVDVGTPKSAQWRANVREFVGDGVHWFAWIDTSQDVHPPRIAVVKADARIRTPQEAVQADVAQRTKEAAGDTPAR